MMLNEKNPATDNHDTDINLITIQWYEGKKNSVRWDCLRWKDI